MTCQIEAIRQTGAVIIVNWNRSNDTAQCVFRVLQGSCTPATIIVVDNGSERNDYQQLVRLVSLVRDQVVLVRSDVNGGFAAGANLGYWVAKEKGCTTAWFLNNDTLPEMMAYEALLKAACTVPQTWGALSSLITKADGRPWYIKGHLGRWSGVVWHGTRKGTIPEEPSAVEFVSGCSVLIPLGVIEPPFSERYFMYGEDVELSIRLNEQGRLLFVVPTSVVRHQPSSSLGGSPDFFYYMARNRLLLTNVTRRLRWWAALPYVVQRDLIPALFRSRVHGVAVLHGVRDYFWGRSGKRPQEHLRRGMESCDE
jgi:GT2 family glycosyltransferase